MRNIDETISYKSMSDVSFVSMKAKVTCNQASINLE